MTENNVGTGVWLIRILFGLWALVSIACIMTGGSAWGYGIARWAEDHYLFKGWGMIDWIVGLFGGGIVAAGLLLAGFFFRFLSWNKAPLASLGLAVVSVAFLIATFLIYSQTGNADDSNEVVLLQGICILGLFVLALPPFLHWMLARPRPASATTKIPRAS
ncbi:MAG: hypothetical protein JWM58_441 [Rhizobium sp.]|nr:hypothetical protein [Rhizobium sp.]